MKFLIRITAGLLCVVMLSVGFLQAQSLVQAEYFFDSDPGVGNGTALSFTSGTDINITKDISATGLSSGFHHLYIRFKDENNKWSLYQQRTFYIQPASASEPVPELVEAEYFFDSDPGVGNGTSISLTSGTEINLVEDISTAGLSSGFHNLYVRFKDENNKWGLYQKRTFYIQPNTSSGSTPNLTAAEYFFDSDPGPGNGTAITFTSGTDISFTEDISTAGLSSGFHNLYIRFKDENNKWGLYQKRTFYIQPNTSSGGIPSITAAEYFFDADPGVGSGTAISFTSGTEISFTEDISTTGLSSGFHNLYIRFKDENNKWGLYQKRTFYIQPNTSSGSTPNLTAAEYFFDSDPGPGNGTAISFTNGTEISFTEDISTTGLSSGFHNLYIRFKDENNKWGLYQKRTFYIQPNTSSGGIPSITAAEYFFDSDPGVGNGTAINISQGDTIDWQSTIGAAGLSEGTHYLNIRVKDENDKWSIAERREFTTANCPETLPDFSVAENCEDNHVFFTDLSTNVEEGSTYAWDIDNDGNVDYTDVGNISHIFTEPGSYTASLTIVSTEGCSYNISHDLTIQQDLENPVISSTHTDQVLEAGADCSVGLPNYTIDVTASDNCDPDLEITQNPIAGTSFTGATNIVTLTVTDNSGNTAETSFNVAVEDVSAPVADAASLSDVSAECEITSLTAPTATDNCAGTLTGTHDATLPIAAQGATVVTWTYDDGNGNTSTQTQNVVIDDVTAPVADVASLSDVTAECEITSLTAPTATDNCVGTVTGTHDATLPISTQGTTVVTWTYEDLAGNSVTQNQNVILEDLTNPSITCAENQSFDLSDGESYYVVSGTELDPTETTDNCGTASVVNDFNDQASLAGEQIPEGNTTIVWTVSDHAGNTETCSFDITVNAFVGIETLSEKSISIYPNPTDGMLSLTFDKFENFENVTLELTDITGKRILKEEITGKEHQLNLTDYENGIYILYLKTEKEKFIAKVVKQ